MTQVVLAPCSPFSLTSRTVAGDGRASSRLRRASPHHLCETFDEERYTLEHYSSCPVARMETMGWLGDDVWFAHAVHVNDDEIREFARTGAGVATALLEYAARLWHSTRQAVSRSRGARRVGRRWVRQQRRPQHPRSSAAGDAAGPAPHRSAPPEGPQTLLSTSDPLRAKGRMTAREALEIATRGGAAVLGRSDIGALAPGMCADFFSIDLNTVDYAGALNDLVAATVFCAPKGALHGDRRSRRRGRRAVATVDMAPVIEDHNRFSRELASAR